MRKNRFSAALGLAALLVAAGAASAQQVFISEILINPEGGDNGYESIEIMGPPGMSLAGYKFIILEGDLGPRDTVTGEFPPPGMQPAGTVDKIIDLSAYTLGSNGLLLIRDSANIIPPAPSAGTNVVILDFNPDIENGGNTFILGHGTLGAAVVLGTDLDLNDDSVLDDLSQWADFIGRDAVSYQNGDETGHDYAGELGGTELGDLGLWTPDALYRLLNTNGTPASWAAGDLLQSDPGQPGRSFWDPVENFGFAAAGITIPSPNTTYGIDLGIRNMNVSAQACYADCDHVGGLTGNDFQCFLNAYVSNSTYANCDGVGGLTGNDFQCFLDKYVAGCP